MKRWRAVMVGAVLCALIGFAVLGDEPFPVWLPQQMALDMNYLVGVVSLVSQSNDGFVSAIAEMLPRIYTTLLEDDTIAYTYASMIELVIGQEELLVDSGTMSAWWNATFEIEKCPPWPFPWPFPYNPYGEVQLIKPFPWDCYPVWWAIRDLQIIPQLIETYESDLGDALLAGSERGAEVIVEGLAQIASHVVSDEFALPLEVLTTEGVTLATEMYVANPAEGWAELIVRLGELAPIFESEIEALSGTYRQMGFSEDIAQYAAYTPIYHSAVLAALVLSDSLICDDPIPIVDKPYQVWDDPFPVWAPELFALDLGYLYQVVTDTWARLDGDLREAFLYIALPACVDIVSAPAVHSQYDGMISLALSYEPILRDLGTIDLMEDLVEDSILLRWPWDWPWPIVDCIPAPFAMLGVLKQITVANPLLQGQSFLDILAEDPVAAGQILGETLLEIADYVTSDAFAPKLDLFMTDGYPVLLTELEGLPAMINTLNGMLAMLDERGDLEGREAQMRQWNDGVWWAATPQRDMYVAPPLYHATIAAMLLLSDSLIYADPSPTPIP